jgi:hypothetical protein
VVVSGKAPTEDWEYDNVMSDQTHHTPHNRWLTSMKQRWNDYWQGKLTYAEKAYPTTTTATVHHKLNMDYPGNEPGYPLWGANV